MNIIIFIAALTSLIASLYYFFYDRNLFLGSIALILTIIFNIIYAVTGKINEIDPEDKK